MKKAIKKTQELSIESGVKARKRSPNTSVLLAEMTDNP
jgi:hypothetical protein